MSSQCFATNKKFAFLTSQKSYFELVQRPKGRWKCHASPRRKEF